MRMMDSKAVLLAGSVLMPGACLEASFELGVPSPKI